MVDVIVDRAPIQMQTTNTSYDPRYQGNLPPVVDFPHRSSASAEIARRVAHECGWRCVNIGFGISAKCAAHPIEEGHTVP